MKEVISFCIALLLVFFGGVYMGTLYEKQKPKESPAPSEEVIKRTLELYKEKVKIPDNILIGIPGRDSLEVHLFNYQDAVEGLKYVGIYKR